MGFKSNFVKLFNKFEDLFLANHACISCRREVLDGAKFSLCGTCLKELDVIDGRTCLKCGDKLNADVLLCDRCNGTEFHFDKNYSLVRYDDISGRIIKRFKYSSRKYYAKYIAELMTQNTKIFESIDYLTFVPIGEKRRRERGFNQAEEIAREISKLTGKEVVEILRKVGNEKHQAGLSQKERMENLKDSFVLVDESIELLKGKTILIIDDVFTTGATLSECAKVIKSIKKSKPKAVISYTFAKTELFSSKKG